MPKFYNNIDYVLYKILPKKNNFDMLYYLLDVIDTDSFITSL